MIKLLLMALLALTLSADIKIIETKKFPEYEISKICIDGYLYIIINKFTNNISILEAKENGGDYKLEMKECK